MIARTISCPLVPNLCKSQQWNFRYDNLCRLNRVFSRFSIDLTLCDLIQHNSLKHLVTPCFFYIFSNIYPWCKPVPNISDFSSVEVNHANSSIYQWNISEDNFSHLNCTFSSFAVDSSLCDMIQHNSLKHLVTQCFFF